MKALSPLRLLTVPLLVLAVLPGCKRNSEARNDPEWWRLEGERVALAHEIDLLKLRACNHEGTGGSFAAVSAEVSKNAARMDDLKDTADALREDVATLAAANAEQRDNWLRTTRAAAMGQSFASLTGANGRNYQDVVVTKITDIGIEFRHSTGSARLAAEDMSPEQHAAFGLDPNISDRALAKENAKARAYESWVDGKLVTANAAKEAAAQRAEEQQTERISAMARARTAASELASTETSSKTRLRDEPRSFGSSYRYSRGNTTWYPSYYGCTSRYYYVNSLPSCYNSARFYYSARPRPAALVPGASRAGASSGAGMSTYIPPVRNTSYYSQTSGQ